MKTNTGVPKELKEAMNFHTLSFISKNCAICLFRFVNVKSHAEQGQLARVGMCQIFVLNLGLFIIFVSSLLTKQLVRYSCLTYASILYAFGCIKGISIVALYTPGDNDFFNYFITIATISGVIVEMVCTSIYQIVLVPFSVQKFAMLSSSKRVIEAFVIRQQIVSLSLVNLVTWLVFALKYIVYPLLITETKITDYNHGYNKDIVFVTFPYLVYLILILWLIILILSTVNFDEEFVAQRILALIFLGFNMVAHIIVCSTYILNFNKGTFES